ncbi:phage antirepressor Ant [Escherichia coli]|jgi:anti-repressor protein|uniref:phage antirepressor Ant n=1 Tax=Escherichia coli TaxID=562 RepID=UPI000219C4EA|nr:phage antirepressor Ant [Escherichia coli]EEZ8897270.1 phage antirepressor Ant [Escherichia coli O104]EGR60505.1 phage anti-repressor protein AntB [Escherichia coli O104:H4 str. 01-09591]ASQ66817.1 AntB [Escherichia coli NCCP15648]EFB3470053.1 phage antirepressor Ant [Escherichia coli]EFB7147671.1 phage antirepressor Ant [Escherichia coli]
MTNQLIPVFDGTINNEPVLLCNARNLHAFLGIGKMFAHWIKDRLGEYGFVENQDFVIACQNWQAKGRGGHNRKEYHLTLDTAKELAMVERNEKGRQIRRYFIECEKKLRNIQPVQTEQQFTTEEIILLCYMQLWMEKAQQLSKQLYPVMRELNSDYYGKLFDLAYETRHITNRTRDTLLREAAKLDPANYMVHRARSMLAQLRARQFEF